MLGAGPIAASSPELPLSLHARSPLPGACSPIEEAPLKSGVLSVDRAFGGHPRPPTPRRHSGDVEKAELFALGAGLCRLLGDLRSRARSTERLTKDTTRHARRRADVRRPLRRTLCRMLSLWMRHGSSRNTLRQPVPPATRAASLAWLPASQTRQARLADTSSIVGTLEVQTAATEDLTRQLAQRSHGCVGIEASGAC